MAEIVETTGITIDVNAKVKVDLSGFVQADPADLEDVILGSYPSVGLALLDHFWIIPK